jgi:diketogulonate reductase-like aldo/keto reductase
MAVASVKRHDRPVIREPSRREVLAGVGAGVGAVVAGCRGERAAPRREATTAVVAPHQAVPADAPSADPPVSAPAVAPITRRRIPSSGEEVPAIGLGSWSTFDVAPDRVAAVQPVLAAFLARGGRVVDSSPMYGDAEAAIGAMLANLRGADAALPAPFLATKVWTSGERAGQAQMRRSMSLLGAASLDLMQIHNLLDWKVHLNTLRAWKQAGTFRYIGVTHYQHAAFDQLERIVRDERVDFVQLPYSLVDRAAEARLLPAAADAGVAVLVMQPFESGGLFRQVRGRPLPPVAAELRCTSWAQLFLVWLLGHPAVTCPIPATSKPAHLEDNMGALTAAVPDQAQRAEILRALAG